MKVIYAIALMSVLSLTACQQRLKVQSIVGRCSNGDIIYKMSDGSNRVNAEDENGVRNLVKIQQSPDDYCSKTLGMEAVAGSDVQIVSTTDQQANEDSSSEEKDDTK